MEDTKMLNYVKDVLENMPTDWLNLTTHRLDIYDENLAKERKKLIKSGKEMSYLDYMKNKKKWLKKTVPKC